MRTQTTAALALLALASLPLPADEPAPQMSEVTAVRTALNFGAQQDAMQPNGARDYYAKHGISAAGADAIVAHLREWNTTEYEESKTERSAMCAKRSMLTTDEALDQEIQNQRADARRRGEARVAELWQKLTTEDAANVRKLADFVKSNSSPIRGPAYKRKETVAEYLDKRCGGAI